MMMHLLPVKLVWFVGLTLIAITLYLVAPVLTPFFIAIFIAYIANPAVTRFENSGTPRWVSMLIGIAVFAIVIFVFALVLLPTLKSQLSSFSDKLPDYIDYFKQWLDSVMVRFNEITASPTVGSVATTDSGSGSQSAGAALNELAKESLPATGEAAGKTVNAVKASAVVLLKTLTNLFLIPVIAFYLLRDWNDIIDSIKRLIPSAYRKRVYKLASDVDDVLKSFLHGQFLVMCALGAMYSAGLLFIGLEYSLLIGVAAGVLSFVPFLGTAVGLLVASTVMFIQTGQILDIWKILVVFSVGQFIEGNVLTPKLVGEKLDLHPVVVIFAVLAGGELFGFTGILVALPVAAIMWVIVKDIASTAH